MKELLTPATTLTTLRKIAFTLLCCTVLMVFAAPAQVPPTLVGAPTPIASGSFYGMYPNGVVSAAAGFTLSGSAQVTTIDVVLLGNGIYDFSLQDSLTAPVTTYASATLTAPTAGPNTETMAVNATLPAGTYYIVGTGDPASTLLVPGWYESDGTTFITNAGSVANGEWASSNGGPWNFMTGFQDGYYYWAPMFTVYGSAAETLTLTELGLGAGTVTDNLGQINCSEANGVITGTCSASYASGTPVTLTATESTFGGWGGACASFVTNLTCNLTMNSAQNVSASFNGPGPTQAGTVTTGTETVFDFAGGFANGGYDYNAQLTSGSPVMAQVTAIPVQDQTTCNTIVDASFPGAQCFVYQNANGPGTNMPVMFELTCPGSPDGTCGSISLPNFLATLGTDFNFTSALNPFNPNEPLAGWLKGVGSAPLHPCTPNTDGTPLFQSNQISSFSISEDPGGHAKGGSGGTGSCWLLTYSTPNEAPTVTIAAPVNYGTYQQGQTALASYTCTTVNYTNVNNGVAGPYLTQASCSATDSPGGSVANGAQFDTTTLGPHTFTATVVDSALNTVSQTYTYNVVGATDVAILTVAPPRAATGSKLTYGIGVGDLGRASAVNVTVNDTLPPGTAFVSASGSNVACSIVNRKLTCPTLPIPCAFAGGTVSCNVGTIMPLSISSLNGAVIQITVKVTATAGTRLSNTAAVSASNADRNPSNNSSTASTTVTAH